MERVDMRHLLDLVEARILAERGRQLPERVSEKGAMR
jgi:hypothetical protein